MKPKIKQWENFLIITGGKLQEFTNLWSYIDNDTIFYIFKFNNQIQNISQDLVYKTKVEAERAYMKQLKESAKNNYDLARKIKENWMELVEQ